MEGRWTLLGIVAASLVCSVILLQKSNAAPVVEVYQYPGRFVAVHDNPSGQSKFIECDEQVNEICFTAHCEGGVDPGIKPKLYGAWIPAVSTGYCNPAGYNLLIAWPVYSFEMITGPDLTVHSSLPSYLDCVHDLY